MFLDERSVIVMDALYNTITKHPDYRAGIIDRLQNGSLQMENISRSYDDRHSIYIRGREELEKAVGTTKSSLSDFILLDLCNFAINYSEMAHRSLFNLPTDGKSPAYGKYYPGFEACSRVKELFDHGLDPIKELKADRKALDDIVQALCHCRKTASLLNEYVVYVCEIKGGKYIGFEDLTKEASVQQRSSNSPTPQFDPRGEKSQIRNARPREGAIDRFKTQAIVNDQSQRSYAQSIGGTMYAISDFGNVKGNNEDMYLMIQHSENPDFSIAVVADGMGGGNDGEYYSQKTCEMLEQWFSSLPITLYNDPERLEEILCAKIEEINTTLYNEHKGGGTTLVCYITCNGKTVAASVGDSRMYVINKRGVQSVFIDQSLSAQMFMQNAGRHGIIAQEDAMMHYKQNNKISNCIGNAPSAFTVQHTILDRSTISSYILCSDGLSDLVRSDGIFDIVQKHKENPSIMLEELVALAKNPNNPYLAVPRHLSRSRNSQMYRANNAGKDNITATFQFDQYEEGRQRHGR